VRQSQNHSIQFASNTVWRALFHEDGLKAIFEHARNLVVATIIIAAGFETVKRFDAIDMPGLSNPLFAGYVVAGVGCLLVALNFIDGLRKLAKLRWHFVLQAALTVAYMFFSLRMVQLIILFRTHTC
jgi:hypothetical protein